MNFVKKLKKSDITNFKYTNNENIDKMKKNKKLADQIFNEIKIQIYYKNIFKDCPKCEKCNKNFIDNLDRVITTNCGHIFHYQCFKNHILTNLICPKCPICDSFLLEFNSEKKINITSISENNLVQTIDDKTFEPKKSNF